MIKPTDLRIYQAGEVLLAAQEAASQSGRLSGENRPDMAHVALVPEHVGETHGKKRNPLMFFIIRL